MRFTNKGKQKRPKFLFFLQINELVNIPQSSGYCYVKWNIKEGTGTTKNPLKNGAESYIHTSTQSKGVTSRVLVEHHRAEWNYSPKYPVELKLHLDKNRDIISKCLCLEVYFEFLSDTSSVHGGLRRDSHSFSSDSSRHSRSSIGNPLGKFTPLTQDDSSTISNTTSVQPSSPASPLSPAASSINGTTPKVSSKMFLGSVLINLAEYIREDELPITNRFLLRDSKINSILNVTIQLRLTRGNYSDFNINSHTLKSRPSNTFKNDISNIFIGGDKSHELISPVSSIFSRPTMTPMQLNFQKSDTAAVATGGTRTVSTNLSTAPHGGRPSSPFTSVNSNSFATQDSYNDNDNSNSNNSNSSSNIPRGVSTLSTQMNSLVDSLYAKTFQLPWDPRPNEFSPAECVEDILRGGDGWAKNENGINMIDLQVLKLNELESEYYSTGLNGGAFARYEGDEVCGGGDNNGNNTDNTNNNWQSKGQDNVGEDEGKRRKREKEKEEEERNWDRMDRREFMDKRQQLSLRKHPDVSSLLLLQRQQSLSHQDGIEQSSGSAALLGEGEGSGRHTSVEGSDSAVVLGYTKSWSVKHIAA